MAEAECMHHAIADKQSGWSLFECLFGPKVHLKNAVLMPICDIFGYRALFPYHSIIYWQCYGDTTVNQPLHCSIRQMLNAFCQWCIYICTLSGDFMKYQLISFEIAYETSRNIVDFVGISWRKHLQACLWQHTQIARIRGQHRAHLGPVGPR